MFSEEEIEHLFSHFLFHSSQHNLLPQRVIREAERQAHRHGARMRICRSQTFGFFIIDETYSLRWVERNAAIIRPTSTDGESAQALAVNNFISQLRLDANDGIATNDKTVSRQQAMSGGEKMIYPRIYIDGNNIVQCGMSIDDSVKIIFDRNRNMIVVVPNE